MIPYGVDADGFPRGDEARARGRALLGVAPDVPLVVTIGRFVKKKGFEYLIDAVPQLLARHPTLQVVLAGHGDLENELRARAWAAGLTDRVRFPGLLAHQSVPLALAAADVAVVPSIRDDAGNVDGLPNVVLEALASGTPVIATPAGGIGSVVERRRERSAGARAGRGWPRRGHRPAAHRPRPGRRAGEPGAQPRAGALAGMASRGRSRPRMRRPGGRALSGLGTPV